MNEAELQAIRARVDAATLGPWMQNVKDWWIITADGGNIASLGLNCTHAENYKADAAFIAAARSDVPALLDEVERLRVALKTIIAVADDPLLDMGEGAYADGIRTMDRVYRTVIEAAVRLAQGTNGEGQA